MLLERIEKNGAFGGGPFSVGSLHHHWLADLLAGCIDHEVTLVSSLILDHAEDASIFDPLISKLHHDFVVLILSVLDQLELAVRAVALVGSGRSD